MKLATHWPLALVALVAIAGCGGSSATLGHNSSVEVTLSSRNISDLELIVSPKRGTWNDADSCWDDSTGFGCSVDLYSDSTVIKFETQSYASDTPYYVYVRNKASTRRTFSLDIVMDDDSAYGVDSEVLGNEKYLIAEIRRNNAGSPSRASAPQDRVFKIRKGL